MKLLLTGVAATGLAGAGFAILPKAPAMPASAAAYAVSTADMAGFTTANVEPPATSTQRVPDSESADLLAVPLEVSINGTPPPYEVWHHLVMPGGTVSLGGSLPLDITINGEAVTRNSETLVWTAPDTPGTHLLTATDAAGREYQVAIFVLAPLDGAEVLEGYRIGTYPADAPEGLIRLTEADMDVPVSPNFTIGQFICKQQPGHWPKFVLVTETMLTRVEVLLAEMQARDMTSAPTFFVMSGFRTPFYNTAIGSARFSRHMYGDAADIYPDVLGGDGVIDDLNGDGVITRADAELLYDLAEELYTADSTMPAGGIGAYSANAVHGPFVHIDGRGHAARWGRNG